MDTAINPIHLPIAKETPKEPSIRIVGINQNKKPSPGYNGLIKSDKTSSNSVSGLIPTAIQRPFKKPNPTTKSCTKEIPIFS